ncbi:hypothetical protein BDA99DRAFT_571101 [Phascolomyces articulosus]|uniref:Uncharacterized protein n=1 Tax=Phascolomyces articulosus TaxID=60185 RepID=A0AAD5KCR1_9FUNG|nr:hypothetical protein BDA99DRAFT_571101 [Phascolomyces articulosus]
MANGFVIWIKAISLSYVLYKFEKDTSAQIHNSLLQWPILSLLGVYPRCYLYHVLMKFTLKRNKIMAYLISIYHHLIAQIISRDQKSPPLRATNELLPFTHSKIVICADNVSIQK